MREEPRLAANGRLTNAEAVRSKVEQDIAFLTDRIASLKSHARPNEVVIETYQDMLDSRLSVLKWLQEGRTEAGTSHIRSIGGIN